MLVLRGAGVYDVAANSDSERWVFTLPAMAPGHYWWQVVITDLDGARHFPLQGELDVTPSLMDQGEGYDGRSEDEKALAAVEATLRGKATKDQLKFRIKDRELERYPVADLIRLRTFLKRKVLASQGKGGFRKIGVML